ncbi:MAG: hypothetical protein JHC32_05465 [Candidatus Aminicenantes bacterium]|jgi:hypothetical protein|nr:hypothetical protein [Candidatus Aminicenantes bacterium]
MKKVKNNSQELRKTEEKKENKVLEMPLSLKIIGINHQGQNFEEISTLSYISSEEASFLLKTDIDLFSLLKLIIPLPQKLTDGQDLSLILKGKVISIEPALSQDNFQKIRLKLDSRYIISSDKIQK